MSYLPLVFSAFLLAGASVGEMTDRFPLRLGCRVGMNATFLLYALAIHSASSGPSGLWIAIAVALAIVGDVALQWRERLAQMVGIAGHLLAHGAYIVAFGLLGIDPAGFFVALAPLLLWAFLLYRWAVPRSGSLAPGVILFVAVTTLTIAASFGALAQGGTGRAPLLVASLLLYVYGLLVVRDLFFTESVYNRIVGLPLFCAAQLTFVHFSAVVHW